ncbi:DUF4249 domain-containing protein [Fulvivirga sp. M361]|uniref:DUF4249 domain-containing protein n=1 Tax=Fulvivirga sp. M361 TaxID=2594266 RepID=UPI001628442D|nr:DUF4249 domain-containing protein [Fulvivirga sp. M361]
MKKIVISTVALYLYLMLTGCDKEVDVILPSTPNRLIIEGRVEKIIGESNYEQHITLSLLNEFFDQSQTPRVSDATVMVRDSRGNNYMYTQDTNTPGRYFNTELKGEVGETYTLSVVWDGQTFEATETLMAVAKLDTVYQKFEEENAFEDGGIKLAIDFTDPVGDDNYYFWEVFSDGVNLMQPDPGNSGNVIARDEFWDGQKIEGYFPNEEKVFEPGDEVLVRHIGVSEETYDFLFLLFEQTGQTGQLIDVPPALIKGNIRNLTDPENIAMGYFGASEVDEEILVITER